MFGMLPSISVLALTVNSFDSGSKPRNSCFILILFDCLLFSSKNVKVDVLVNKPPEFCLNVYF